MASGTATYEYHYMSANRWIQSWHIKHTSVKVTTYCHSPHAEYSSLKEKRSWNFQTHSIIIICYGTYLYSTELPSLWARRYRTSWSPLCSMQFTLSIITWNSKIPHMSLLCLTNRCTKYLLTLISFNSNMFWYLSIIIREMFVCSRYRQNECNQLSNVGVWAGG